LVNDAPHKNANCKMKKITDENKPALALFALRNLKIGEELRYDYGLLDLPWRKNKGNLN
jgi:hypothetical protein